MEEVKKKYRITVVAIFTVLLLPLAQEYFHFFKFKELDGEYTKYNHPSLTLETWLDESFQDSMERYCNLHFGFSSQFTRLHNQLLYSFFRSTRSPSVVIGKQNEIYDYGHIQSYLGQDFIGAQVIQKKIRDLQDLQQVFTLFNTQLVIVIAPSKASFVPEHLPNKYKKTNKATNYDLYDHLLKKTDIPFVNFSTVFKKWKTSAPYPLYPQCGVHWSEYGATLAADSMLKYIEKIENINLPDLNIDSVVLSQQLSESDYDMGRILNLMYPIKPYPMAYPKLKVEENDLHQRLSLLSVSDSYYWIWYNQVGFSHQFFKNSRFYEYYKKYHTVNGDADTRQLDIVDQVIKSDIILIVCSESNLYRLGYGFIEEMHQLIPEFNKRYHNIIRKKKLEIMQDEAWYLSIQSKASQNGISVDSMLTIDAKYVTEHLIK